MDVSAEAADLVVKEGIQATESAVKLAGSAMKNVAALLLALQRQDNKVIGKTTAKRLARDPAPAEVIPLKKEDMRQFKKLAKEYGILYFFAQKKGNESGMINVVSNQNYAAQLNAVMIALGYPVPQETQEGEPPKKSESPCSTREVLARAREWLQSLALPSNIDEWLEVTAEQLVMKKCAWWCSLEGQKPTTNRATKRITIPDCQIFSPAALVDLMKKVKGGEKL